MLAGRKQSKAANQSVEDALQALFGSHAGWAHNTLFIAELASMKHLLLPREPLLSAAPETSVALDGAASGLPLKGWAAPEVGSGEQKVSATRASIEVQSDSQIKVEAMAFKTVKRRSGRVQSLRSWRKRKC